MARMPNAIQGQGVNMLGYAYKCNELLAKRSHKT